MEDGVSVKAVLFDIDGTLVDSNGFHVEAWDEAFRSHGTDVPRAAIAGQIGKGGDLLVRTLAPDLPDAQGEAIREAHDAIFKADYLRRVRPFPQARALIERVHARGQRVVLASSASRAELDHYVDLLGIGEMIDAATSADDVEQAKPAPDIFGTALKKAGVAPDEARAVGDSPFDIESAGKAGVRTVAVLSGGFSPDALKDAEARFADVAELLARYDDSPLA